MASTELAEYEDVDLDTFDLSAFVIPSATKDKGKLAVQDAKTREVEKFMAESSQLFQLGERYEVEVVERGHKALYDLLSSIYSLAQRIEENPLKEKILEAMRKELKDKHEITVKTNSTPITVMVKYVVRTDKVTASRYTKVLSVAHQENIAPSDLPDYITRRGGVSQIQDIESVALAKKTGDRTSKERTALIRELFNLVGMSSKMDFQYEGDVAIHTEAKETSTETSSFCVFIAHHVSGENYKIISANDLGKSYEDNLIKYLGKEMPNDLHVLERGVRNYKKRIAMDTSQPKSLRDTMERQLAEPLKYKKVDVIEMEASETNAPF
jgi:hypothetical protein